MWVPVSTAASIWTPWMPWIVDSCGPQLCPSWFPQSGVVWKPEKDLGEFNIRGEKKVGIEPSWLQIMVALSILNRTDSIIWIKYLFRKKLFFCFIFIYCFEQKCKNIEHPPIENSYEVLFLEKTFFLLSFIYCFEQKCKNIEHPPIINSYELLFLEKTFFSALSYLLFWTKV